MSATREATVVRSSTGDIWHAVLSEADFQELERCTPIERVELLKEGVPARLITGLVEAMEVSRERLYRTVGLARSTGDRKLRRDQRLDAAQGEPVLELARLIGQVERMLQESGDPERIEGFSAARWLAGWLEDPLPALGGRRPAELMDTAEGRKLVSRLLIQMQTGAYG